MRFALLASTIATFVSVIAAPTGLHARADVLVEPRVTPAKPAPCVRDPSTTKEQNKDRFDAFVQALIYKSDITKAFSYITQDYAVSMLRSGRRNLSSALTSGCNDRTTVFHCQMDLILDGMLCRSLGTLQASRRWARLFSIPRAG